MMRNKVSKLKLTPNGDSLAVFTTEKEILKNRIPVCRKTWLEWRNAGLIPFIRIGAGRRVMYHWPTVEAAILRMQQGPVVQLPQGSEKLAA